MVYGRIVCDAYQAGALKPSGPVPTNLGAAADDAKRVRDAVLPGVPEDVAVRCLAAWASLFGLLNLELFGHFDNVIQNRSAIFDLSDQRIPKSGLASVKRWVSGHERVLARDTFNDLIFDFSGDLS